MTDAPEVDVATLGPLERIGGGGQGQVFTLRDDPDGPVYKEYSPRVVDDLDVAALHRFVRFVHELDASDQIALLGRVAWPEVIVRRDGVVRGFLMRRVPSEYTTELRFGTEVTRELALVQFLLNPPSYLADRGLSITTRLRLEFLRDTAEALALFHRLGISVGDLSPNNLLFSLTTRPRCFFVDPDGMRLGEDAVLSPAETPDWRVGDIGDEELGTPASDVYKFGLLAVRLFASDQQATDPSAVPRRLRPHVLRCLAVDPDGRPAVDRMLGPLDRGLKNLHETAPPPPPPAPEPEPERPEPEPRIPVPQAAPPATGGRRWTLGIAAAAVVLGVIVGVANDSDGGPTPIGASQLPTGVLPSALGLPPVGDIPGLPTPPIRPGIVDLPTYVPPTTVDLGCLLHPLPAPDVRGGAGLAAADGSVSDLLCTANQEFRDGAGQTHPALAAHAPYTSVRIVGFFGEGTASPSATVDFEDNTGKCWRAGVGLDARYAVRSVGPLSACG